MKNLKDLKISLLTRTSQALDTLTKKAVNTLHSIARVHDYVDEAITMETGLPQDEDEKIIIVEHKNTGDGPLTQQEREAQRILEQVHRAQNPESPSQRWPQIVGPDQFYATVREECLIVESIIRKHIGVLCGAMGVNPVSLPIIIVSPSTFVYEGIQPDPGGACVRVNDEGIVTQIRVAGIRLEGMTIEDEEGEETFGFFQKGSEAYVRAVLESVAMQLAHIIHDDTRMPDGAWDAAEKVAYRVAKLAVDKVLGPAPEGWSLTTMIDDDNFGEN